MYWPIRITGVSSVLHVPHTYAQGPPVPLGLFIRNVRNDQKSCCIAYWRILRDHQSIRLVSGINDFLRCQRLNRHGLRMKTLSCIIYVFIYVHELVNLEVPRRTPSRTRCRPQKKTCWVLFPRWKCVDPKPECTSWSSTCRFSQLNFDCKLSLGARYEARDVQYNFNLAYVFTTREEFWSQSVGFKSERMQLIWVSFTSEYLQVNVVHLSANETRCPSQQPLFYSRQ